MGFSGGAPPGRPATAGLLALIVTALFLFTPVAGLVPGTPGPHEEAPATGTGPSTPAPVHSAHPGGHGLDAGIVDVQTAPHKPHKEDLPCPTSVPACPWTDPPAWWAWAHGSPLDELAAASLDLLDRLEWATYPAPSALPGYAGAAAADKRAAWVDWWHMAASGTPEVPHGQSSSSGSAQQQGEQASAVDGPVSAPALEDPKVGKPRNLVELWRLQAHGTPIGVHPWGDAGQLLVTGRGAFHFPSWDEPADWMVRFDSPLAFFSIVGRTALATGGDVDTGYLVVEYPDHWGWGDWETLHVVDLLDGSTVFKGFAGTGSALAWTLSDVTGDGAEELLVLDNEGLFHVLALPTGETVRVVDVMRETGEITDVVGTVWGHEFHSAAFADATGDGIMDLYVVRYVEGFMHLGLAWIPNMRLVTLYGGQDGEIVWEVVTELQTQGDLDERGRPVVGDLTGDGRDDLVFHERRWGFVFGPERSVTGVAAVDGSVVFQDLGQEWCIMDPVCPQQAYLPVAVLPIEGGQGQVVGLKMEYFYEVQGVVVRAMPEVPGLPTLTVHERPGWLGYLFWEGMTLKVYEWAEPGAGNKVLVTPFLEPGWGNFMFYHSSEDRRVFEVDAVGLRDHVLDPAARDLFVNPVDGEASGWFLGEDRWAPLTSDYQRETEGHRLLQRALAVLWYDANGDGIKDALVPKTAGHVWVSGKDATVIRDVDVEPGWNSRSVGLFNGAPVVLELRDGVYTFRSLEGDSVRWTLDASTLGDGRITGWEDFTGDGRAEVIVRTFPQYDHGREVMTAPVPVSPEKWAVQDPRRGDTLWELEGSMASGTHISVWFSEDVLPERRGKEILVHRFQGQDKRTVELHVPGESSPRWSMDLDTGSLTGVGWGLLLTVDFDEEDERVTLEVRRGTDRQVVGERTFTPDRPLLDARLLRLNEGGVHLGYSYATIVDDPGQDDVMAEQRIRVEPAQGGDPLGEFATYDQGLWVVPGEDGPRIEGTFSGTTWMLGSVGDWSASGVADLALREEGHFVVRSTTRGDLLAVGPRTGNPCCFVDLNGDGRDAFGVRDFTREHLRMYGYDGAAGELRADDDQGRVTLTPDENATAQRERYFEPEKSSPGPAVLVAAAFAVLLAAIARVRRRRCD